jgi:hypothetical protein
MTREKEKECLDALERKVYSPSLTPVYRTRVDFFLYPQVKPKNFCMGGLQIAIVAIRWKI